MTGKPNQRVVVTGLGVVSPIGNSIAELTKQVFAGVSSIKIIDAPFVDSLNCKFAAQAKFDPAEHFSKYTYSILDRTSQMALHTTKPVNRSGAKSPPLLGFSAARQSGRDYWLKGQWRRKRT